MKKSIVLLSSIALLASCSSDYSDIVGDAVTNYADEIVLTSNGFEFEEGTRTAFTLDPNYGLQFAWVDGDEIGVFPVAPVTNCQAMQVVSLLGGKVEASKAVFSGAGWKLDEEGSYAAYYPFNGELPSNTVYDAVPVNMVGQKQNGNSSLAHISEKYDVQYAASNTSLTSTGESRLNFEFKHMAAVFMLEITSPVEASWKSVTLTNTNGDKPFTTEALLNVYDGKWTAKATSSTVNLDLDNIETEENGTMTLFISVLPADLSNVEIIAETMTGETFRASMQNKTIEAGKVYKFTSTLQSSDETTGTLDGYEWVDLGLSVKWATKNVGASSVLDCGNYFAWGELTQKDNYTWDNYKFMDPNASDKYGINAYTYADNKTKGIWYSNGTFVGDGRIELLADDDVATKQWSSNWRMPTSEECEELVDECTWTWVANVDNSNVSGWIVVSNKEGYTDKFIFIPAAGYYSESVIENSGISFSCWSKSLDTTRSWYAVQMGGYYYDANNYSISVGGTNRYEGNNIRPVCEK